jgi:glyoxylase-like metal-dependent hydrolase (beta-lactamase superfamily II)
VSLIPVLRDNYVFVLHGPGPGPAVVVDPAVAEPVITWLEERGLELVAILHTHHHSDHIGGTPELLRRWPQAAVIASGADLERIPLQTRSVAGGDRFTLLGRSVEVLAVPGHTRHHIAYYLPAWGQMGAAGAEGPPGEPLDSVPPPIGPEPAGPTPAGELFCGDTLFAGGCGRLFEGTPAQILASLDRLAALPADIGLLPLVRLQLGSNNLTALPASFGRLERLTLLELNENALVDVPVSALRPLTALTYLDLRRACGATVGGDGDSQPWLPAFINASGGHWPCKTDAEITQSWR